MKKNKHHGPSFESFLEEEGILEEVRAAALKWAIARLIRQEMKKKHLNKVQLAQKMKTSRSALDRLLDPENTSVSLKTLVSAGHALGRELYISFA